MPLIPLVIGELIVSLFAIWWGAYVETRYASKWTITFNVVAMIVILMTLDLEYWLYFAVVVYVIVAILIVWRVKYNPWKRRIRHLFGNKGYGSLALALGLSEADLIGATDILLAWIITGFVVYLAWFIFRQVKGYERTGD